MHTVKLRVSDSVYDKFIGLLRKFNKDEVEIIPDSSDFTKNQRYLAGELNEILIGEANFIEMDEAEQRLENILMKHENSI
ncbi:MAG: tRNA pseudouridine synthase A [Bacteroidota bacterium]